MRTLRLIRRTKFSRGATSAWVFAAIISAVALAWVGWRISSTAASAALTAEASLSEFRQVSIQELLINDSSAIDDLGNQIVQVRADLQPLTNLVRWVKRFYPAISWLPIVRQEALALANQVARVNNDFDAASTVMASSSTLLNIYSYAQTALLTPGADAAIPYLKSQAVDSEEAFIDGLSDVQEASRKGRSFSIGLQIPRVRDLMNGLEELEGQMKTGLSVGRQISGLMVELLEVAEAAQPLLAQFTGNGSQSAEMTGDDLEATLVKLEANTISARNSAKSVAHLVSDLGQTEQAEQLAALDQVLAILLRISRASKLSFGALETAAEVARGSDAGLLSEKGGLMEIFDAFASHHEDIAEAISEIEEAQRIIDEFGTNGNVTLGAGSLSRMSDLIDDLHSGLLFVNSIAPLAESLLGEDGPKRYLVLGQTADELRGTGGFVSSVWVVTFERGGLQSIRYHDAVRIDDWDRLELYPKAPPDLEEHMNAWVWLLRDVSWDPDFPTTARSAEDLFRLGQRQDVDGVIAINQWSLLRILEALDSIPTPDGGPPLTSRNLISVLEKGTDRHGRAYIDLVLQGVLESLNQQLSVENLIRLASGVRSTLQQRDTLVFFDDPDLQSVMAQFGWDGSIDQGSTDYLYVVDSNVGWSKADRNIQRGVSYVVDLRKADRPRASLILEYANHSAPGSSSCEPQWLNRGVNYSQLKNACYWNFLRVYMTQGGYLLSSTRLPLPEYSVFS